MSEKLNQELAQLRTLRTDLKRFKQELSELETEFRRAHQPLYETVARLQADVESKEAAVRALAVEAFYATGSRQPANGVTIKQETVCKYEPDKALRWCIERSDAWGLLELKKTQFEKVAKELRLEFVQFDTVPKAYISRDLEAI